MLTDYELNVVGAVKCLQISLPAMRAAGSSTVVMFSTVAVPQGLPMHASVAAAKGAVEGIALSLAVELAPNIRVNSIDPRSPTRHWRKDCSHAIRSELPWLSVIP